MKKFSREVKSSSERANYFQRIIKTPHSEKETYAEKSYDRTDTSPVNEEREIPKKESRWRPFKKKVEEKAKNYWYLAFIAPLSMWLLSFLFKASNDIAVLKERTKDIQFMRDTIITIDKNVDILKVKNEKNGEILDLKIQALQKRVNELDKK